MDREQIIQFLKSEPMKFTYAEIEQMMDEEIDKDPSEMDTDFIDLCAKVLCKALDEYNEKEKENKSIDKSENKKRIRIRISKFIAVAAIFAIILCSAVTVSAKYVYNDTSDKIVKFYEDHFSINLRNGNTNADIHLDNGTDLIAKLKDSGFDNIMLPSVLLTEDYTYDVKVTDDEEFITAFVTFHNMNNNTIFSATIAKYKNGIDSLFDNDIQITSEYDSAKQLSLNGIDILVFGNKDTSTITYINNDTDYGIDLINCNFDTAIEIAESIK